MGVKKWGKKNHQKSLKKSRRKIIAGKKNIKRLGVKKSGENKNRILFKRKNMDFFSSRKNIKIIDKISRGKKIIKKVEIKLGVKKSAVKQNILMNRKKSFF